MELCRNVLVEKHRLVSECTDLVGKHGLVLEYTTDLVGKHGLVSECTDSAARAGLSSALSWLVFASLVMHMSCPTHRLNNNNNNEHFYVPFLYTL